MKKINTILVSLVLTEVSIKIGQGTNCVAEQRQILKENSVTIPYEMMYLPVNRDPKMGYKQQITVVFVWLYQNQMKYSHQSQQTQTAQWANQNDSKQRHVNGAKRGKTCAS